jgi:Zn-dependent protease with chaperone function/competence protein ComGC
MLQPPPLAPIPPVGLAPHTLTLPKENSRFILVLLVSIAVWLGLAITMIGIFYALLFGFFLWLGNGLLTAYLRAEAVRVGPDQLPELDASLREVCRRLGVRDVPALYVLQSGGLLNAFATRFAGRDFVVVYSDFLEALGPSSPEMRFILGHELGHIQSRHILKQIFLAPGLFCPLLGPAYRRAWETSCDRFGAYASQDVEASVGAMLVLSGGREHGRRLNAAAFAGQHASERGFFVSLHELTSTYPTLSRRVTDLMALKDGSAVRAPDRNPLAYLVALFMPGGNVGNGGPIAGFLMVVVVIGLMAAMAIPAFEKVRQSSQAHLCVNNQRILSSTLQQYALDNDKGADTWDDIVGEDKVIKTMPACPLGGTYNAAAQEDGTYEVTCTIPGHDPASLPARPSPR